MNPFKAFFLPLCAAALIASCAEQMRFDRDADPALTEYRTTCLKRRLAIDTPEHSACVAALYQERQNQLARLRTLVAPTASPSTDVEASSEGGVTGKGSTASPGAPSSPARSYETNDNLRRGY